MASESRIFRAADITRDRSYRPFLPCSSAEFYHDVVVGQYVEEQDERWQ